MTDVEGYQREKVVVETLRANLFSAIMIIPTLMFFGLPFFLLWNNEILFSHTVNLTSKILPDIGGSVELSVVFSALLGIMLHVLIHGFFWSRFAINGIKSIKIGMMWGSLTPYCRCQEPLLLKHYRLGAIMPFILLGLVPSLVAIVAGDPGLIIIGMFFTLISSRDLLTLKLLAHENRNVLVMEHPVQAGCYIYRKKETDI
jgi:hypothetical protein